MPDPTQDPDFLAAPSDQQNAYLMDTDPDYAKASPQDQHAYLQHVNSGNPLVTGAGMGAGNTVDPATVIGRATNPINNARLAHESLGQYNNAQTVGGGNVPAGRTAIGNSGEKVSNAIGVAAPILAGIAGPAAAGATIPAAIRIATMSGLGAAGGRYAGGGIGGMFGPTGKEVGETAGSLAGGLAGGIEGYRMVPPNPEEALAAQAESQAYKAGRNAPGPWSPTRARQAYNASIKPQGPVDPYAAAVKNRTASWIPTTMPQEASTVDPLAQAVKNRTAAYLPTRMTPPSSEAASPYSPSAGGASSSPQDLISRTRRPVLSGEQPTAEDLKRAGDFTQVPLQKLKLLSRFGDKLAENEILRRQQQ